MAEPAAPVVTAGTAAPAPGPADRFPRAVAALAGVAFVALGLWAMAAPRAFFATLATFEPYNQHFLQDVGAFQIGLGAVLLLAALVSADALAAGLLGVGIASALHTASHIVGINLGGNPPTDIPALALLSVILLGAGWLRLRGLAARRAD
jgi:hypothetical protein